MTLTIDGLHNLRDVAVPALACGVRMRRGLVFRSAAPLRPGPQFAAHLRQVGITQVVDLRDEAEQHSAGWAQLPVTVMHRPIFANQLAETTWESLADLYHLMLSEHGAAIVGAVEAVATAKNEPLLIHCTAGKDRTGVVVAAILSLLGVARGTIVADFALSGQLLGAQYLADLAAVNGLSFVPGVAAHRATMSPPELLAGALGWIDREYGTMRDYLDAHGATPNLTARLDARLRERTAHAYRTP